jgi:hypothetical protein
VRYHDFHLSGYDVRRFGAEITLHLIYENSSTLREESHIRFSDVGLYHFVHTGSTIILGIDEVPLSAIIEQFWDRISEWTRQHGGVRHFQNDTPATFDAKLAADRYKAWDISSSIGFAGFVIAESISDVTDEFTPTA